MIKTPSLSLVQDHLKANVDALRDVGLAAEFAGTDEAALRSPTAFVLPAGGPFDKNKTPGRVSQVEHHGFAVVLAFKRAGRTGEGGIEDLEPVRDAVLQALMGHVLEGAKSAISIKRSHLVDFNPKTQRLWWQISCVYDHRHTPAA